MNDSQGRDSLCAHYGCTLPAGHNMGKADIPEHHNSLTTANIAIPEFPFSGGMSQAGHWLAASARLDAGYLPGGSNTRQTLAKLCRSVAYQLDATAVEPKIAPHALEWHKFDKDDKSTWPSLCDSLDCWIMVEGHSEPETQHWDPANCGPERGWDSIRAEYVTHWMLIAIPSAPEATS